MHAPRHRKAPTAFAFLAIALFVLASCSSKIKGTADVSSTTPAIPASGAPVETNSGSLPPAGSLVARAVGTVLRAEPLRLTAPALAVDATVEIVRLDERHDAAKAQLLAAGRTSDRDATYAIDVGTVGPRDVLMISAYDRTGAVGRQLVAIGALLEGRDPVAVRTLEIKSDITTEGSVVAAVLTQRDIPLSDLTAAQLALLETLVETMLQETPRDPSKTTAQLAAEFLESRAFTSALAKIIGTQTPPPPRAPDIVAAWEAATNDRGIGGAFGSLAEVLGLRTPPQGDPARVGPALLDAPDVLTIRGAGMPAAVRFVLVTITPRMAQPAGQTTCIDQATNAFRLFCPMPLAIAVDSAGAWEARLLARDFQHDARYALNLSAADADRAVMFGREYAFRWANAKAPDAAFTIAGGATHTVTRDVALQLTDPAGVATISVGHDGACLAEGPWVSVTNGLATVTLSEGDGPKELCVHARNDLGQVSAPVRRTIHFDGTKPVVTLDGPSRIGPAALDNGALAIAGALVDGGGSGLAALSFSVRSIALDRCLDGAGAFSAACPNVLSLTPESPFRISIPAAALGDGVVYEVSTMARDVAGNEGSLALRSFTWDASAPSSAFTLASPTNATSLSLSLAQPLGDTARYRTADGADCSAAAWRAASTPLVHTVAAGDGSRAVCLQLEDAASNAGSVTTATVVVDRTAPTSVVIASGTIGPALFAGVNASLTGTASDVTTSIASVEVSLRGPGNSCASNAGVFDQTCPHWLPATGTGSWSLAVAKTAFTDGQTYQLTARAHDAAGNVEATPSTGSFLWEDDTPSSTFTIGSGDPSHTSTQSVTLVLASAADVAEYRTANGSCGSGATWSAWTTFGGGAIAHTLAATDGLKTVCLETRNAQNVAGPTASDTITLDTTQPTTDVTIGATLGPVSSAGATTILAGTAADATSGVSLVSVSIERLGGLCLNAGGTAFDAPCPVWRSATGTNSWTYGVTDALLVDAVSYEVTARATDNAGNVQGSPDSATFTWDATAPSAAFQLAGGAVYATATSTTITLTTPAGVAEYRAANGATCTAAPWTSFGGNPIAHTLAGPSGTSTVCVQTRDAVGNVSNVVTDDVFLDTTAPAAAVSVASTLGPASTGGAQTTLGGTSTDDDAVAAVHVSLRHTGSGFCLNGAASAFDAACPVWRAATGTTSWTYSVADSLLSNGVTYTVSARATDVAGNVQATPGTGSFAWDSAAPSAAFGIAGSAAYATSTSVTLDLTTPAGVADYRAANGASCAAATWGAYAAPVNFALTAGDGSKTVCLEVRDAVGNVASSSDTIILDTTLPGSVVSTSGFIGPATTGGASTTLAGTASDTNGIASVAVSLKAVDASLCLNAGKTAFDAVCPVWLAATGTTSWTISVADALFTDGKSYEISSRATDVPGLVQGTPTDATVTWDSAAPATFSITAPTGTITATASPTATWSASTGAAVYDVSVGTAANCAVAVQSHSDVAGTSKVLDPLSNGTYYLCVRARDAAGNTTVASNQGTASFVMNTTCDSGTLATTCTISSVRTLSAGGSISGSGNLVIASGGNLTTTAGSAFSIDMDGSVTVEAGGAISGNLTLLEAASVTVASGATITAAGWGHAGGAIGSNGTGAGGGTRHSCNFQDGGGGSHGGVGGKPCNASAAMPAAYGSASAPVTYGSGGASGAGGAGGAGGGAIKIVATGAVNVGGTINANGNNAPAPSGGGSGGGGAGGSVWIVAASFSGAGTISATGGQGATSNGGADNGGGGGGGRIMLDSTGKFSGTLAFAGGLGGGTGGSAALPGNAGSYTVGASLDVCDSGSLATTCTVSSTTYLSSGFALSGTGHLVIASGGSLRTLASGVAISIALGGDMTVATGGAIDADISALTAASLTVANGATLAANIADSNVTGAITVATGGSLNADGRGHAGGHFNASGSGPGGGTRHSCNFQDGGGGSHAGVGGKPCNASAAMPAIYGVASAPVSYGSGGAGGAGGKGGAGGGAIRLVAGGTVTIGGTLAARGAEAVATVGGGAGGGGAGGSIQVSASTLAGTGTISVIGGDGRTTNGGADNGGGGGGGYVALLATTKFPGTIVLAGGAGIGNTGSKSHPGDVGQLYLGPAMQMCDAGSLATSCMITTTTYLSDGATLSGAGSLVVEAGGALVGVRSSDDVTIDVDGDVTIKNGGSIAIDLAMLSAQSVTVESGGHIRANVADSSIVGAVSVAGGATIDASGRGFSGGYFNTSGSGPGGGTRHSCNFQDGGGGSHGGVGGRPCNASAAMPAAYGVATAPVTYGSGGAGGSGGKGGAGGGALKIVAGGTVTIQGSILALGADAPVPESGGGGAGGAGGSVWIVAPAFAGSGTISAVGGVGRSTNGGADNGGGGGGGRIMLDSPVKFSGTIALAGGVGVGNAPSISHDGGAGTYRASASLNVCDAGTLAATCVISTTTYVPASFAISGAGNLQIASGGLLTAFGSDVVAISLGGELQVQSGGAIAADLTLEAGSVVVASGGTISANITDSLVRGDVTIGGTVSANGRGFAGGGFNSSGAGTGGGTRHSCNFQDGGGGSHAGVGGKPCAASAAMPAAYGSAVGPTTLGSGGAGGNGGKGGNGGGALKLVVGGTLTIDGTLSAKGDTAPAPVSGGAGGGGAGGSVWIDAVEIAGAGTITVAGGNGRTTNGGTDNGGGGGGGRVALYYASGTPPATILVTGGLKGGTNAFDGAAGVSTLYGLNTGFNRIFVSSQPYDGDLAGVGGAAGLCATLANAAGYPGSTDWVAILSTSVANASALIAQNGPVLNPRGEIVAASGALFSGMLTSAVRISETYTTLAGAEVWTGSTSTGSASSETCAAPTSWMDTSASGTYGVAGVTGGTWLSSGIGSCTDARHLYCISQAP